MPKGVFEDRGYWLSRVRESSALKRKNIDESLLVKRYVEDGISTYALQKEFNLTNNAIRKRLKNLGIKLRGCSEAQKLIDHVDPYQRYGHSEMYRRCQSVEARKKRSESHKGKKFTDERRKNMSLGIGRGMDNKNYKGDSASYSAKHVWICNNWEKTGVCERCGKKAKPDVKSSTGTHWANISGVYDRENRADWLELCRSCHKLYDGK